MESFEIPTKQSCLPIKETEYGYEQRSKFVQFDRVHEEIIELESPLAASCSNDASMLTYLIVGDQNAGKSTFMHAFAYADDKHFTELLSALPLLSAVFVNARYLSVEERKRVPALDEPPFIDTDVATAMVALTIDDYAFLRDELDAPLGDEAAAALLANYRYVALRFVELGGDHLDRLMSETAPSDDAFVTDVVARSRRLLRSPLNTIVYFVNADTLFDRQHEQDGVSLNARSFATLLRRIEFLDATVTRRTTLLVYVSRAAASLQCSDAQVRVCASTASVNMSEAQPPPREPHIPDLVHWLLSERLRTRNISIGAHAYATSHLNESDGSLNVDGIMRTLKRLFHNEASMVGAQHEATVIDAVGTRLLLAAYRDAVRTRRSAATPVYVNRADFEEYLEEQEHNADTLPPPLILSRFEAIASALASRRHCLLHHSNGFADSRIRVCVGEQNESAATFYLVTCAATDTGTDTDADIADTQQSAAESCAPAHTVLLVERNRSTLLSSYDHSGASDTQQSTQVAVRFPYTPALLDALNHYYTREVPAELWFDDDSANEALGTRLHEAEAEARTAVETAYARLERTVARIGNCSESDIDGDYRQFVYALEDWSLTQRNDDVAEHLFELRTCRTPSTFALVPHYDDERDRRRIANRSAALSICVRVTASADDSIK